MQLNRFKSDVNRISKLLRYHFSLLFIFRPTTSVFATKPTLVRKGTTQSNQEIASLTVSIKELNSVSTLNNIKGLFSLNFPEATWDLKFRNMLYADKEEKVAVKTEGTHNKKLIFSLNPYTQKLNKIVVSYVHGLLCGYCYSI